jgi:calcineurin-like phosphoesterase family protein
MSTIFYTADTHFGHEAIIRHCNRPFATVEEMDEALIEKWNSVVTKRDIVYHLGDVGLGNDTYTLECVSRLNGRKRLISGNHDSVHPRHRKAPARQRQWMNVFESVNTIDMHRIGDREVMLSHFPYAGDHTEEDRMSQWRPRNEFRWLLHGHIHTNWVFQGGQYNVGVDVHDFAPISVDYVKEMFKLHEELMAALDVTGQDEIITSMKEQTV